MTKTMLRLLLASFMVLFVSLSLASYSLTDPSWVKISAHKLSKIRIHNHCGLIGAHVADLLFRTFGLAAWLCPAIILHAIRMEWKSHYRGSAFLGWVFLMFGAAILVQIFESHQMYRLPYGPGGYFAAKAVNIGPLVIGGWGLLLAAGFSVLTGALLILPADFAEHVRNRMYQTRSWILKLFIPVKKLESFQKAQSSQGEDRQFLKTIEQTSVMPPQSSRQQSIWAQDGQRLIDKLKEYGISAKIVHIIEGPVIVRFEIQLAPGERGQKIANLSKDLSRALKMGPIHIIQNVPGKSVIALEVPQPKRQVIPYFPLLKKTLTEGTLPLVLGVTPEGDSVIADLAKLPHLLVAGSTGSGKSVAVNSMLLSLIANTHRVPMKFLLIDPKILEFSCYQSLEQLAAPVIVEPHHAVAALRWCVDLMQKRYRILADHHVQHINQYHQHGGQQALEEMPYFIVVIDELADLMLMTKKAVEEPIARLAQKARACGIHLIIATQRPSVDVITGLIKANIPSRIALAVSSKIDSRTILDQQGAENLLGAGDAFFLSPTGHHIDRVHGAYVGEEERKTVLQECSKKAPQFMITLEELCEKYSDEHFE